MRSDLSKGMTAAQVTHAAGESSTGRLPLGTYAVVLGCDQKTLLALERHLQLEAISFVTIRENDEPYESELMAIGVQPGLRSVLKPYFTSLKLLH